MSVSNFGLRERQGSWWLPTPLAWESINRMCAWCFIWTCLILLRPISRRLAGQDVMGRRLRRLCSIIDRMTSSLRNGSTVPFPRRSIFVRCMRSCNTTTRWRWAMGWGVCASLISMISVGSLSFSLCRWMVRSVCSLKRATWNIPKSVIMRREFAFCCYVMNSIACAKWTRIVKRWCKVYSGSIRVSSAITSLSARRP